jgi:hypothetical protein
MMSRYNDVGIDGHDDGDDEEMMNTVLKAVISDWV